MRLLVDGTPLHSGGGVQVAAGLLQGLAGSPIHWRALLPEAVAAQLPEALQAHPAIIRLPKRGKLDLVRIARACRAVEADVQPDLVFTVFGPAYFKARAPHLVGFALPNLVYPPPPGLPAPGIKARGMQLLRQHMIGWADHLVVETDSFARRTARAIGFDPSRIHVVRNAVNPMLEGFVRKPLPEGGVVQLLVPSAYYPHKNLEAVPRVAAALEKLVPDAFRFNLTLDSTSQGWARISALATQLGVADRVATLGVLPLATLAQAYRDATLVFLPTLREASTAVYPEAFHFGRPLVTTDIDFAHELCGDAALFVDPHRPDSMAAALASLIMQRDRAEALVAAGTSQLAKGYPTAKDKFAAQLRLFEELAMR